MWRSVIGISTSKKLIFVDSSKKACPNQSGVKMKGGVVVQRNYQSFVQPPYILEIHCNIFNNNWKKSNINQQEIKEIMVHLIAAK